MDLKEQIAVAYRHPWELSRTTNLLRLVADYINEKSVIADIGAGDMFFTQQISQFNQQIIYAVDTGYSGNDINGNIKQYNHINLLPDNAIDCVILMDVLEHIKNESEFLELLNKKVKQNGVYIITVPAFQFLYTEHDKFLNHYRRYNKNNFKKILLAKGLVVEQVFYFYTALFFIRWVQMCKEKLMGGKIDHIGMWKYEDNAIYTRLLKKILDIDFVANQCLNKLNINFAGLSLVAVARKK